MGVVNVKTENGIRFIEMNRPDKRNALSTELVEGLITTLKDAEKDAETKVIILSGAGKAFSAGGDITTFSTLTNSSELTSWMKMASNLTQTITKLDKYVISAVHGFVAGAGFSIALASDFILADERAQFISSFTNIGLIPDLGLIKQLVKRVPPRLAKEWISSGVRISAAEAYDKGVVNRVVNGDLLEEAITFAQFIIEGPPLANKFVKYLINYGDELTDESNLMQENIMQSMLLQTEDHKKAVEAFFEKKKPTFTGN